MSSTKKRALETESSSSESSTQQPPVFIRTLYSLLKEKCDETVCRWSADGRELVIVDPARFAAEVCPKCFRHRNFASFTRLLNMYGFHKVPAGSADGKRVSFCHASFVKDNESLLRHIQRKTPSDSVKNGAQPRTGVEALVAKDVWTKANQEIDEIQKRMRIDTSNSVSTWMRKVVDLEREVKQLSEDNARLREMEIEKAQLYSQLASQNEVIVNLIAAQLQRAAQHNNKGPAELPMVSPTSSIDFDRLHASFAEDNPSDSIFDLLEDHQGFD